MNKMKWSRYNTSFPNGDQTIYYNCASDTVMAVLPQIKELLDRNADTPDALADIHPPLYRFMVEKGFLIDAGIDELQALLERWTKKETDRSSFTLTVNPTLDCNLRCWYCYEAHKAGMDMSSETVEAVKRLIDRKMAESELERLNIGFFGGEPLMRFNDMVHPILFHAQQMCDQYGKKLGVRFTTNGVLLTEKVLSRLVPFNKDYPVFLQITLDGNRELHDQVRVGVGRGKTFDLIVRHIRAALQAGMELNVRFNYTAANVDSFGDVLSEFENLSVAEKDRLTVDYQPVWQDGTRPEADAKAERQAERYSACGLHTAENKTISPTHCYADFENSIVINYTGDLYKCTAREFHPQLREGVLSPDGQLLWNNRYRKRMAIKHGTPLCHACRIFPLCHGGCSQTKLERAVSDVCYYQYSEADKDALLRRRGEWILRHPEVSY